MTILRHKTSNKFCGPAALSALTGRHVDETARLLRLVSGKRAIKGIQARYMLEALKRLGYKAESLVAVTRAWHKPTLTQLLAGELKGRKAGARYLVIITGHYITIEGRRLVDNKHPAGVALTACPYRRRRVRAVWLITGTGKPAEPVPAAPMTRARFEAALDALGLSTDGRYIDAPVGFRFASSLHSLAVIDEHYEDALGRLVGELPLADCPGDCFCRDEE